MREWNGTKTLAEAILTGVRCEREEQIGAARSGAGGERQRLMEGGCGEKMGKGRSTSSIVVWGPIDWREKGLATIAG